MTTPRQQVIDAIADKYQAADEAAIKHNICIKRVAALAHVKFSNWTLDNHRIAETLQLVLRDVPNNDPRAQYVESMSGLAWVRFRRNVINEVEFRRKQLASFYVVRRSFTRNQLTLLVWLHQNPDKRLASYSGGVVGGGVAKNGSIIDPKLLLLPLGSKRRITSLALRQLQNKGMVTQNGTLADVTIDIPALVAFGLFLDMIYATRGAFYDLNNPDDNQEV